MSVAIRRMSLPRLLVAALVPIGMLVNTAIGNYVIVWTLFDTSVREYNKFFSAEIDWQGQTIAAGFVDTAAAPNPGIAFNSVSRTFAVVAACQTLSEVCARELNEHGETIHAPVVVTDMADLYTPSGAHAASGTVGRWLLAYTTRDGTYDQLISTATRDGGAAGTRLTDLCVGSDPFAFFGGGVCVYGGWVPPNHPAALRGGPPVSSTPPPGGCTTPDPFTFFGGGVCVNGGWVPKDHPLANQR